MNPEVVQLALSVGVVGTVTAILVVLAGVRAHAPLQAITSYAAHILFAAAIYVRNGLQAPDAKLYDLAANQLLSYWTGQTTTHPNFSLGKEGWPAILAALYRVTYPSPILGLLVNACACGLLVAVLALVAHRLELPVTRTAWIVTLLPPVLFWGSLLLREALAWLVLAGIAYALAGLTKRDSIRDWSIFVLSILTLLWVRGDLAPIVAGGGLLAILFARRRPGPLVVAAAAAGVLLAGPFAARLTAITGGYSIEQFSATQEALARTADTSGFEVAQYSSFGGLLLSLPQGLSRSVLGPFPWEWPSLNPLFMLDAVLWLLVVFYSWRGWRRCANRRRLLALVLPAAVLVAALALTSGNYGTMQRLRVQAAVLLVPIAAAGIGRPQQEDAIPAAQARAAT